MIGYDDSGFEVRNDILAAHAFALDHLSRPGAWWTGSERLAIAAESRAADDCGACVERKAALSPNAAVGAHDGPSDLPAAVVDVIHRVRTDPGRLSRAWFDSVVGVDLEEAAYVELIGVLTLTAGLDYFARSLGVAPLPFPRPQVGEPSRYRPAAAQPGGAWVPWIEPDDQSGDEADLYDAGMVPHIERALSLVPDEVRALRTLSRAHYFDFGEVGNPAAVRPPLDRLQMELIAGRVSALNECFY
jgi:hypothetical protein